VSTRAPRHRGETTPAQQRREREIVLWMIFLVGAGVYLVLLSTVWGQGATALGILSCGVIGFYLERWRGWRSRRRAAEERLGRGEPSAR
jgi:hypothetical protein